MARRIRRFLKEKTSDRVYPKTLLVAALTAATVALVTAQLTSLVDSLVLVSLASLFTAFIGEAYRLTLESVQAGIARAVGKAVSEDESENREVQEEVLAELQGKEEEVVEKNYDRPLVWLFFHRVFVSRWAVPLTFAAVALLTVAGSYGVGRLTADPEVEVRRITRDVSPQTVREIEAEAGAIAEDEAADAVAAAEDSLSVTRDELMTRIEALEAALALAEERGDSDSTSLALLRSELEALSEVLLTLQEDSLALEDRVSVLEEELANQEEPSTQQ